MSKNLLEFFIKKRKKKKRKVNCKHKKKNRRNSNQRPIVWTGQSATVIENS